MYAFYRHEPIFLVIEHDGKQINMIKFISEEKYWEHQALELIDKFTNQIKKALDDYFAGIDMKLELDYVMIGSDFEKEVWEKTREISAGQTASYGEIAQAIDNPGAARAVGTALGKNHLPLLIPCHRIIGTDGELHGFAGGLEIKQWLLDHEAKCKESK
jgi:methylated-DNA-[protein]-cysteine S-methyltransferase